MSENNCGKCFKGLSDKDIFAKCVECKLTFHAACTRAGSSQSFTKSKNKTLKCDSCADETKSNSSVRSNEDKDSILEAIRALRVDIYQKIDDKINDVLASVSSVQQDIKNLQESVTKLDSEQEELRGRCVRLEHVNEELAGDVSQMQLRLHDAEQHSRAANIEIVGVPASQGEDVYSCLEQIAKALGVGFSPYDFSIAHRLRTFSGSKHAHPPIIAQFSTRRTKEVWIKAIREKKSLRASDINPSLPHSTVYINEHLTPNNKALLGRARRLRREGMLVFAGYFNGKVLVKESEGAEAVRVTVQSDLDKYIRSRKTPS